MPSKDTRKEHKELVREQKELAARRAQRTAAARRGAVALVLAAVVGGGVLLLTQERSDVTASASADADDVATLLSQAASASREAGCKPAKNVGTYQPSEEDGTHDGAQAFSRYPSIPPASGPHSEDTVSAGVYGSPVDMGAAIHSLEHGAVVVWYDPSVAESDELAAIEAFLADNDLHVILSPFDYPDEGDAGRLPKGAKMALTAWHYNQTCEELSLPVVADFMSKYRTPPLGDADYLGEAPEPNTPI